MTKETIQNALDSAVLFIRRADAALEAMEQEYYFYGKETSAVKRASMDLTRALAEMRKP